MPLELKHWHIRFLVHHQWITKKFTHFFRTVRDGICLLEVVHASTLNPSGEDPQGNTLLLSRKFAPDLLKILLHLNQVATLPYEITMSEN